MIVLSVKIAACPGAQTAILRQPAVRSVLQLPVQKSETGAGGQAWAAAGAVVEPAAAQLGDPSIDQLFLQVRIVASVCCIQECERLSQPTEFCTSLSVDCLKGFEGHAPSRVCG